MKICGWHYKQTAFPGEKYWQGKGERAYGNTGDNYSLTRATV